MSSEKPRRLPGCLRVKPLKLDLPDKPDPMAGQLTGTPEGEGTTYYSYFQLQKHSQWCWVAVASSMCSYYYRPQAGYTQETIFCGVKGLAQGTCSAPNYTDDTCDKPGRLDASMSYAKVLAEAMPAPPPSVQDLRLELLNDRPFALRLESVANQEDGHFVAISGYTNATGNAPAMWYVCDPWIGKNFVSVAKFPQEYSPNPGSTWSFTYYGGKMGVL
jgi:hypothetical protein